MGSQETRRDRWGGNVNQKSSIKMFVYESQSQIWICCLHTTTVIPSCFLAFFSDPYSFFENFILKF